MQRTYSRSKLVEYIVGQIQSGAKLDELASQVAAYLIDEGKITELDSVMRDAQDLRATKNGVVELDVRSVHTIDAEHVKQIESVAKHHYPGSKKVQLNAIHDESVVGGANLSFAHANFDITVRAKLNRLKEAIS